MAERKIDDMPQVSEGAKNAIESAIAENYKIITNVETKVVSISRQAVDLVPDKNFDPCNVGEIIKKLNELIDAATSMLSELASIKIFAGMEKYFSFQIIAKKFQILTMKLKRFKLVLQLKFTELQRKMLISASEGKAGNEDVTTAQINAEYELAAKKVDVIFKIIDALFKIIETALTAFGIDGYAMTFFPTPKSIRSVGITIANEGQSCGDFIPSVIKDAITAAETSAEAALTTAKEAYVNAEKENGKIAAASSEIKAISGGSPVDIANDLLSPDTVIKTVNSILATVITPEALPRYEKLMPYNVRWLLFLMSGFEPAMKQSFGLPGMP